MKQEIYNEFTIKFDEKMEYWYACVSEDGKDDPINCGDNVVRHASLKTLKEMLDKIKRRKFERTPVFVRADYYRLGGGRDEKYMPHWTEATMTSVSPNGNIFVVKKGEKHAKKMYARYGTGIYHDTPENRVLIEEYEKNGEMEWRAERQQRIIGEKMKQVDGEKLYKQVYGKDMPK